MQRPRRSRFERGDLRGGQEHIGVIDYARRATSQLPFARQLDVIGRVDREPAICDSLRKYLPHNEVVVAHR